MKYIQVLELAPICTYLTSKCNLNTHILIFITTIPYIDVLECAIIKNLQGCSSRNFTSMEFSIYKFVIKIFCRY